MNVPSTTISLRKWYFYIHSYILFPIPFRKCYISLRAESLGFVAPESNLDDNFMYTILCKRSKINQYKVKFINFRQIYSLNNIDTKRILPLPLNLIYLL